MLGNQLHIRTAARRGILLDRIELVPPKQLRLIVPPTANKPPAPDTVHADGVGFRVNVVLISNQTRGVELEAAVAIAGIDAHGLPRGVEIDFREAEAVGEGVAEVELLVLWSWC